MNTSLLVVVAARDPDAIRQVVSEVYQRPEFGQARDEFVPNWLARLVAAIGNWLANLHAVAPVLFWFMLVGCLLLLAALLVYVAWTVRRVFVHNRRHGLAGKEQQLRQRLSQAYWTEAQGRAASGEFTEAIRFLFLSLVYRFDEEGRISFQHAYTNHEYARLFNDRPTIREALNVFVEALDDFWYGQRPTDQRHYEHCLGLYQQLTRA